MKNKMKIVRDYLIVGAATLTLTAIFASPLIVVHSQERDNPADRTHTHITENQEAIGKLVASTAQDQEGLTIDPGQEPFISREPLPRRHTEPGITTIIGTLEYLMDSPDGGYLTAEYLVTYRTIGGFFRHYIPGENYRLEDSFIDAASIRVSPTRHPLHTETAGQREPLRIALARMDQ